MEQETKELEQVIQASLNAPASKRSNPEVIEKYIQVAKILAERPGQFSRRELCQKHNVNYHNFSQWYAGKQKKLFLEKKTEVKFRPERIVPPAVAGSSVIVTTMDDLFLLLSPMLKAAIKDAIVEGIKQEKVKALR